MIRLVHLEDDPLDAQLVAAALHRALDCSIHHVSNERDFRLALDSPPDLILADAHLPGFDGLQAQQIAYQHCPDVPFIVVTGTLGEEQAVDRLTAGAADYVLKHRLARLSAAVQRALQTADDRRGRRAAEEELRKLNVELEQRVHERMAALEDANNALADSRRQLHQSNTFLEKVIASSPSMIFRVDPATLTATYVSPNVEVLLGYSADELLTLPRSWRQLVAPEDELRIVTAVLEAVERRDTQLQIEFRCHAKDRQVRWLYTLLRIEYEADRPTSMLGYALDVTEQRRAQQELVHARAQAEEANRAKSEFLSRMSHDLRTPLNAILGFSQLIQTEALNRDDRESVEQILKGGRHLLDLINEVLDIARIEAGHLSLSIEPVSVPDVLHLVASLMRPLADTRHLTLTVDIANVSGPPYVLADKQRLNQVLVNLVSNAVKYNREHGQIRLTTTEVEGRVQVSVSDTGGGIAPDKLGLLFRPFERLGAAQTSIEGTGLGLALSRSLIEAMTGSMGVESAVDRGSRFWFDLPRSTAPAVSDDTTADVVSQSAVSAAGSVLYVEDNIDNLRLMERIVARRPDVDLLHAADGISGLELAATRHPGLILLDLHLPDIAGSEVLRRLLAREDTRRIPVVILSADATPQQKKALLEAGATHYMTKPLSLVRILKLLDETLTRPSEEAPAMPLERAG